MHFIRIVLVGYGRRKSRHEVRDPDMPAPHDTVARIAHRHDSVALFDGCLRHLERQAVPVGGECNVRHQISFILPDQHGIFRCAVCIVVDIGVGDSSIEVVCESSQHPCLKIRLVCPGVGLSVLDGIAVDQR